MPIYDRSTKSLMKDFADEKLQPGQIFTRTDAIKWFAEKYPNIKSNTVGLHVNGMAVNSQLRKHHPHIRPGSGHDLFFKIGDGTYRLWDKESDPAPVYSETSFKNGESFPVIEANDDAEEEDVQTGSKEFAFERDLKNYLAKNLHALESGVRLYEDEGFNGIEFPVGGRYIDILALDKDNNFVVIELKVSRGYDRVIGQIARYMTWIEKNLAGGRKVRGIIVASDISEDLRLAAARLKDVQLFEYEISLQLRCVSQ